MVPTKSSGLEGTCTRRRSTAADDGKYVRSFGCCYRQHRAIAVIVVVLTRQAEGGADDDDDDQAADEASGLVSGNTQPWPSSSLFSIGKPEGGADDDDYDQGIGKNGHLKKASGWCMQSFRS
jgi:hypothetical protein